MKEQVAEIVAAYLRRNSVAASDIPAVITEVHQSLAALGQTLPATLEPAALKPAVSIRRSVSDDAITCLDCGFKGLMLRRHIKTVHGMTPEDYRKRWGLPAAYPVVAPNYAARRSELAKAIGLGKSHQPRRRTSRSA